MFTELLPLLADRTLVLTIARIDDDLLRVNIIPKCKSSKENDSAEQALTTPLSVTGSAADLDRELPAQLTSFAHSVTATGSNLAQVEEAHRAALKAVEADNKKKLDDKRKLSSVKALAKTESATPAPNSGPEFKDGKPVFGTKHVVAQPASLFDAPSNQTSTDRASANSDDELTNAGDNAA